jgi:hypothetical protein
MGHKESQMMMIKTLQDQQTLTANAKRLSFLSVSIPDLESNPTGSLKKNNYGQTT